MESDHMEDSEASPRYSISYRLQRVTTEFSFVKVPVTSDILDRQADGTGRVNVERMVQRAIALAMLANVFWQVEEQRVQPHPIQTPPPDVIETKKTKAPD
jgi:hypothetical protein